MTGLAWCAGHAGHAVAERGRVRRALRGLCLVEPGRAERGSGTVLTLGLVAVVCALMVGIALLGRAQCARTTAQTAADLAALAAAQDVRDASSGQFGLGSGVSGAPCEVARQVARANDSSLTGCWLLDGGVVRVTTARPGGLGAATASARAGPAPSDPG